MSPLKSSTKSRGLGASCFARSRSSRLRSLFRVFASFLPRLPAIARFTALGLVLEAAIQVLDVQAGALAAAPIRRDQQHDHDDERDECEKLGQEQAVRGQEGAHYGERPTLFFSNTRSAR